MQECKQWFNCDEQSHSKAVVAVEPRRFLACISLANGVGKHGISYCSPSVVIILLRFHVMYVAKLLALLFSDKMTQARGAATVANSLALLLGVFYQLATGILCLGNPVS